MSHKESKFQRAQEAPVAPSAPDTNHAMKNSRQVSMPFRRLPASEKPTDPYILVVVLCALRYRPAVALSVAWSVAWSGVALLVLSFLAVGGLLKQNKLSCSSWMMFFFFFLLLNVSSPKGSGPHSEVVLYRGNPWLGRGKPLFHSPVPKISLIYELLNEQRIRY